MGKKTQLQGLIQKLENSLNDQSLPSNIPGQNPNNSFPWGYVLPIALLVIVLVVGAGVIIRKRKRVKDIK